MSDKDWINVMCSGARDITLILHAKQDKMWRQNQQMCEILTLLRVHMLRLHICWWHIAEHAHLVLFIVSRPCNPLLIQPSSWREEENKEGIRYSRPGLIKSQLSAGTCGCWCKVKAMLILPLRFLSVVCFMNYLHAHSRRPGDTETSSTFGFNSLRVILSLETHTSAAALLFYVSFADSSTNSKTDGFWVSSFESRQSPCCPFISFVLLTDCRLLAQLYPTHLTDLMNTVVFRFPMMQQKGNSVRKEKHGISHLAAKMPSVQK